MGTIETGIGEKLESLLDQAHVPIPPNLSLPELSNQVVDESEDIDALFACLSDLYAKGVESEWFHQALGVVTDHLGGG